jgi:hypothetical protein
MEIQKGGFQVSEEQDNPHYFPAHRQRASVAISKAFIDSGEDVPWWFRNYVAETSRE